MKAIRLFLTRLLAVLLAVCVPLQPVFAGRRYEDAKPPAARSTKTKRGNRYVTRLEQPLYFEPNQGQTDPSIRFVSRGAGPSLFLAADASMLVPQGNNATSLTMRLVGGNTGAAVTGLDPLPGISNYLTGSDPAKWTTGIIRYTKVQYAQVYPGVNLVYYGNQHQLEYDFIVAPGADYRQIRTHFEGARSVRVDASGDLLLETSSGQLRHRKPVIYQEWAGLRNPIPRGYAIGDGSQVGFDVGAYDPTKPLIIDPFVYFSTYLGGSGDDRPLGIAVDRQGNAYVTGSTTSPNFPTKGPLQGAGGGKTDAFVTKIDGQSGAVVYSTYLGGSDDDTGRRIKVDAAGNAYVAGTTRSPNFPVTQNVFQNKLAGGSDAFVLKLNPAGNALVYSTYLGGIADDTANAFGIDPFGNAYVGGSTRSLDFPVTKTSFGNAPAGGLDGFVTKLNTAGAALVWSGYLGGKGDDSVNALAVNSFGIAFVTGSTNSTNFPLSDDPFQSTLAGGTDAFIAFVDITGSFLGFSSYYGGNKDDTGTALIVDRNNPSRVFMAGVTLSHNFPAFKASPPKFSSDSAVFLSKLTLPVELISAAKPDQLYSQGGRPQLLSDPVLRRDDEGDEEKDGGSNAEDEDEEDDDTEHDVDVGGDDPPAQSPPQPLLWRVRAGDLSEVPPPPLPPGDPTASTIVRGVAAGPAGTLYLAVETTYTKFPVSGQGATPAGVGAKGYILKFSNTPPPPPPPPGPPPDLPKINAVANGASFNSSGPGVSAGSIVSLIGALLAGTTASASTTPLPTTLGGASVAFSGKPAPLFYASPTQINAQVPWELPPGPANAIVTSGGKTSAALQFTVAPAAPGIFLFGSNRAVVQNQDFSINNVGNPATVGSFITVYLTGGGALDNPVATGAPAPLSPLSRVKASASATIGGQPANIQFLGLTPQFVGVVQANIQVPPLSPGDYPLVITVGGVQSNTPTVTVSGS